MKIGVYLMGPPNQQHAPGAVERSRNIAATPFLRDLAVHAEQLGFDSFWLPDHVVMPVDYDSDYPYQAPSGEGFLPYPFDDSPFPEPFTALTFIAGATQRILLVPGVLILPERNPVLFAKQVATLDVLSGGRFELGVGIGWLREEYEAVGVPWARRGRRMDEYIEAMRALWTQDVASYDGEFVRFPPVRCDPKPIRAGGPKIIIGGHSDAAARRAGRLGDGFMPVGFAGDHDVGGLIATMRTAAEHAGRDPAQIELLSGATSDPAVLDALEENGVAHAFIAGFPGDEDDAKRWLDATAAAALNR
jgi:probable F420-dependent oxidoreductase